MMVGEQLNLKTMMEQQLNMKGPAVATILETMACYELKELHQLWDSEEALEGLKIKLKALPFIKLMTYLKKMKPQHTKTAADKSSSHRHTDLQLLPLQTIPIVVDKDVDPLLECESNASKADLQLQYESEMSIIPVLIDFMEEYELKARVMKRFERSKNRHLDRAKRIVKLLSAKYDSKPSNAATTIRLLETASFTHAVIKLNMGPRTCATVKRSRPVRIMKPVNAVPQGELDKPCTSTSLHNSSCSDTLRNNYKTTIKSTAKQNCYGSYQNAVKLGHNNNLKATAERREYNDQTLSHIGVSNRTRGQNNDSYHHTSLYNRGNSRHSSAAKRWDVSNPLSSQLRGIDASSDLKSTKKKKDDNSSTVFGTKTMNDELSTTTKNSLEIKSDNKTTVQDIMYVDVEVSASSDGIGRSLKLLRIQKNDAMILDGISDKTVMHHKNEGTCIISWDDSYRKYISRKQDILLEEDRIWKFYLQKGITIFEWYDLQVSLTDEISEMIRILCDIALFEIDS